MPYDLFRDRPGNASAAFDFNSATMHLGQQMLPCGVHKAHRLQVYLESSTSRSGPLCPTSFQFANPFAGKPTFELPNLGEIFLFDRYPEHPLSFLRIRARKAILAQQAALWPMCRNENTIIKQCIYNLLR